MTATVKTRLNVLKEVTITLYKTIDSNSAGTINNIAEIGASTDIESSTDIDSIAGNNKEGEDDISTAKLVIGVKTGQTVIYVTLTTIIIAILGFGVYEIKKQVLDKKI